MWFHEIELSFKKGRNERYSSNLLTFREWDKTYSYDVSSSDSSDSEDEAENKDSGINREKIVQSGRSSVSELYLSTSEQGTDDDNDDDSNSVQEKSANSSDCNNLFRDDFTRTTQLVYSYQAGKMVPRLREPRQLYAMEFGPQQAARWPSEIEVLDELIKHISYVPPEPEEFYRPTGSELRPLAKGEDEGLCVYYYDPQPGPFFMKSRVGGLRNPLSSTAYAHKPQSPDDTTLVFESRFESGNLFKVYKVGDYEYELWLRNDLYTNKHTQWFYFRLSNTRPNVKYRFTIVNFMKPDSLYNNGMKPCMYSDKNAANNKIGWVRAGSEIKYYRNNLKYNFGKGGERNYYSLTWTWQAQYKDDTCYFAHCYPYTYSDLQEYLMNIANDPIKSRICKQRVLCRTLAGNLVYVLTITSPVSATQGHDSKARKLKKAVVLTSRVHPGETNASWMMKGFLDFLTGTSPDAKLLRDTFIFKVVPMLNPDGVIVGNYRCSLSGRDLNRNYKTILKDSFPSIWHTKAMIRKLKDEHEIVTYCDLHGHSRKMNVFIYGCENKYNPDKRFRERVFPVMLSKNASDKFSYEYCKFKVQKSKEGTGRIVIWNMGIMNSYTMEATFAGSTLGKMKGYHFSTADFEAMGYHFCDTLLDYCDPDKTKCDNILLELEDRLKQEVMKKLQKDGGAEVINLEDDFTSEMESSDGGSDSSVSDGLPVHLQYLADRLPKKKKKLKTKKERDKHQCIATKTKIQATPISVEEKKKPQPAMIQPPLKYTTVPPQRTKSRDDRTNNGIPIFVQERCEERATKKLLKELAKKTEYLDALTQAYLRSGVLVSQDPTPFKVPTASATSLPSAVGNGAAGVTPHLRYSASGDNNYSNLFLESNTSSTAVSVPPSSEHLSQHHERAYAAHLMNNQQLHSVVREALHDVIPWLEAHQVLMHPKYRDLTAQKIVHHIKKEDRGGSRGGRNSGGGSTGGRDSTGAKSVSSFYQWGPSPPPSAKPSSQAGAPAAAAGGGGSGRHVTGGNGLTEYKPSHKHLVELAAGQKRQQDLQHCEHGRKARSTPYLTSQDDADKPAPDGPIKFHPPPFDPNIDHNADGGAKRGYSTKGSLSKPTSASSVQSRNTKSQSSSASTDRRLTEASSSEQINGEGATRQAENKPRQGFLNAADNGTVALRRGSLSGESRVNKMVIETEDTLAMLKKASSVPAVHKHGHHKHRALSANSDISSTIESIQELKQSLLTSAHKANLNPTTGRYIERIVHQTDKELETIAAELREAEYEKQMESDFQQERREFSVSSDMKYRLSRNKDSVEVTLKGGEYVKGEFVPVQPMVHTAQGKHSRQWQYFSKDEESVGAVEKGKNENNNNSMQQGRSHNNGMGMGDKSRSVEIEEYHVIADEDLNGRFGSGNNEERQQRRRFSSTDSGQMVTKCRSRLWNLSTKSQNSQQAPTKISLMMTRGHERETVDVPYGGTFRPMSRSRPALLRNMKLTYNKKR
ncbi:cytosolic carboxypeptidase 2 isoform X3 [Lingula anatina]|uniref:Cytosolic carboxypeptidase 2 isoform X3 n=1 Tax=Lingula anatina TaxID=7574 RepID=A0A1S3J9G2_LINAN|nr:cytosolic carboxypeptidase 2 isoform X3 [Lingula anatina]|eukprot:XP_013406856.1 cytosolic carboxypeptidase 2 isoform X3 [Lingula anatina]